VKNQPTLAGAMILDLVAVLLGGATYLLPVFAKDVLNCGSLGCGWLRGAEAIGAFVTAIVIAHRPPLKNSGRNMLLAVVGFGLCTIVFAMSDNYWLSFVMLMGIGACDNLSVVVRHSLVQLIIRDSMRGQVSAVNNVSIGASNELGGLESSVTAAAFGPVGSVVSGEIGTLLAVAGVAWFFTQLRQLKRLDDIKPAKLIKQN